MNPGDTDGQPRSRPRDLPRHPGPGAQNVVTIPTARGDVYPTAFGQQQQASNAPRYWGGNLEGAAAEIVPGAPRVNSNYSYNSPFLPASPFYRDVEGTWSAAETTGSENDKGKNPVKQDKRTSMSSQIASHIDGGRVSTGYTAASVPSGFEHLLNPQAPPPPPQLAEDPGKIRLVIREQPRTARACGVGEKGRHLDPTPILQLLIPNFNPSSKEHVERLTYGKYIVSSELFLVSKSNEDGSERLIPTYRTSDAGSRASTSTSGEVGTPRRSASIYSGGKHVSPLFVEAFPGPERPPPYLPSARNTITASPTASLPSTFFIFDDICVRMVGLYRLKFRLVDWDVSKLHILDEVWSDSFRVYAAKDFPGMSPTPYLARQLKMLGAPGIKLRGAKGQGKK